MLCPLVEPDLNAPKCAQISTSSCYILTLSYSIFSNPLAGEPRDQYERKKRPQLSDPKV
jgi:hypothetical protein